MATPNQPGAARSATRLTLEQQRAADAWNCAQGKGSEYVNLAKGLPALIINSGVLQVLAFLNEKGKKESQKHCAVLGEQLRNWLSKRFGTDLPADFPGFMNALMNSDSRKFQAITIESLAWLRWVRQIAPAISVEEH